MERHQFPAVRLLALKSALQIPATMALLSSGDIFHLAVIVFVVIILWIYGKSHLEMKHILRAHDLTDGERPLRRKPVCTALDNQRGLC